MENAELGGGCVMPLESGGVMRGELDGVGAVGETELSVSSGF